MAKRRRQMPTPPLPAENTDENSIVASKSGVIRTKEDAIRAHRELMRIFNRRGNIEKETIVAEARNPRLFIHKHFDWDDTRAAHAHRLHQAGLLVRSVNILVRIEGRQEPIQTRAFVRVQTEVGQRYVQVHDALTDATARRELVTKALRELAKWRKQYEMLTELAQYFEAVDAVMMQTQRRRRAANG